MSDQQEKLNNIEQEILEAASEKAEGLVARATRIVKRIDRQAQHNADDLLKDASKRLEPERQAIRAKATAIVELEMKRLEAKKREALVDSVINEASSKLEHWFKESDAKNIAVALIKEALASLPGNDFVVELDAATSPLVTESDLKSLVAPDASITIAKVEGIQGCLCVTTKSGHARVNQSADARLKRMHEELRREIYNSLFVSQGEA